MTSETAVRHSGAVQRLREALLNEIDQGRLRKGDRIRPLRELAAEFTLSYVAAHRVLRELQREGYVEARGRVGLFATGRRRGTAAADVRHVLFVFDEQLQHALGRTLYGYYNDMLMGAAAACREAKAQLVYKPIPRALDSRTADELTELGASGGVLLVGEQLDRGLGLLLRDRGLRVALVDSWIDESFLTVGIDAAVGAEEAVAALAAQGHRRFGFVGNPIVMPSAHSQAELMRRTVARVCPEAESLRVGFYDGTDQFRVILGAMAEGANRATAIFGGTDCDARAVIRYVNERGIAVPTAMSVVGFGGTSYARDPAPALSTIDMDKALMGRAAVELLLDRNAASTRRLVPTRYCAAGTTGPAPLRGC